MHMAQIDVTTPGVEPGLSRPLRDVLTTRRCGPCCQPMTALAQAKQFFARWKGGRPKVLASRDFEAGLGFARHSALRRRSWVLFAGSDAYLAEMPTRKPTRPIFVAILLLQHLTKGGQSSAARN